MSDLAETHAHVWQVLAAGVGSASHPARFVALATLHDGAPQQRTVGLRAARPDRAEIDIHTDARSTKMAEIALDPAASVLVWDPTSQVQLRLSGTLRARPGTPEEWARVPDPSREAYGHQPPPGTVIATPDAWKIRPDFAHFAVLSLEVLRIDHVSLDPSGHRRAVFVRADGWRGAWLSP